MKREWNVRFYKIKWPKWWKSKVRLCSKFELLLQEILTLSLAYRSDWCLMNFFVLFLTILGLYTGLMAILSLNHNKPKLTSIWEFGREMTGNIRQIVPSKCNVSWKIKEIPTDGREIWRFNLLVLFLQYTAVKWWEKRNAGRSANPEKLKSLEQGDSCKSCRWCAFVVGSVAFLAVHKFVTIYKKERVLIGLIRIGEKSWFCWCWKWFVYIVATPPGTFKLHLQLYNNCFKSTFFLIIIYFCQKHFR